MALVDSARLGRPDTRKVVFRVEGRVANDEIRLAMEIRGAGFGDDFDASAAGAGKFSGVGVVVYADFLDGGGGDGCTFYFDAVEGDGDGGGRAGGGVEEWGEGCDVVLVEDGEFF